MIEIKKGDPVTIEHLGLKGIADTVDEDRIEILYVDEDGHVNYAHFPIEAINREKNIAESILEDIDRSIKASSGTVPSGTENIIHVLNKHASEECQLETSDIRFGY